MAIAVRRTELGLKRKDLAERSSLSYPYVSELENGTKEPSAARCVSSQKRLNSLLPSSSP